MRLCPALLLCALAGCSDSGARTTGPEDQGQGQQSCIADDYSTQISAICDTQVPGPPAAGSLGADCTANSGCTSNICLMPFGSGEHYCSKMCATATDCPDGYTCQDAGLGNGHLCYKTVCILEGSSKADCVTTMRGVADAACADSCDIVLKLWFGCLQNLPKVCTTAPVDQQCGAQAANLKACCSVCDQIDPFYPH